MTDDLDAFRERCRTFLAEHATGVGIAELDDPRGDKQMAVAKRYQGELADANSMGWLSRFFLSVIFPF